MGNSLQAAFMGTLGGNAPAGNETVTLTSSDATKLLLSPDNATSGRASIAVQVGAGSTQLPTFYAQVIGGGGCSRPANPQRAPVCSTSSNHHARRPRSF